MSILARVIPALGLAALLGLPWPSIAQSVTPGDVEVDPAEADPEVALGEAVVAHEGGDDTIAASILSQIVSAEAPPEVHRDAWHLLGRLRLKTGDAAGAVEALDAALKIGRGRDGKSAIPDVIRWSLADAVAKTGDLKRADKILKHIDKNRYTALRQRAVEKRVALYLQAEAPRKARRLLKELLRRWPESPTAREAQLQLAKVELALGRKRGAAAILDAIVDDAPLSRPALEARGLREPLTAEGIALPVVDPLERARWLMGERRFAEAEGIVDGHLAMARQRRRRAAERDATELLLTIQWETGRYADAIATHGWLAGRGRKGFSAYRLAEAHAYVGDFSAAERVLLDRYKRRKGRAYWNALGDLRYDFGQYKGAYRAYYRARTGRKRSRPTDRMIWCLLRMGDADKAAAIWGEAGGQSRSTRRLWTRYWYGRALTLAGDEDKAKVVFKDLADDAPYDYYGIQAWSRLAELNGEAPAESEFTRPSTVFWPKAALVGAWDDAPKRGSATEIRAAIDRFADAWDDVVFEARRAAELAGIGMIAEAEAELRVIDMDLRTFRRGGISKVGSRARADLLDNRRTKLARGGATIRERGRKGRKALRRFKRERSELRAGLRAVQKVLAEPYGLRRAAFEAGDLDLTKPSDAWRDAYPVAYPSIVKTFSTQFDVPPYYLYSIMAVESVFHPHAISISRAYGLLQMIPLTGRRVSAELGFTEFSPEVLLQPEVGGYFGSYYLASALKKFKGQETLAAAAYNAGPHRVSAWLSARGKGPMDMFIEEIPFGQARGYTKSMIKNIARYLAIYHDEPRTYVTNRLDPTFLPAPNY